MPLQPCPQRFLWYCRRIKNTRISSTSRGWNKPIVKWKHSVKCGMVPFHSVYTRRKKLALVETVPRTPSLSVLIEVHWGSMRWFWLWSQLSAILVVLIISDANCRIILEYMSDKSQTFLGAQWSVSTCCWFNNDPSRSKSAEMADRVDVDSAQNYGIAYQRKPMQMLLIVNR